MEDSISGHNTGHTARLTDAEPGTVPGKTYRVEVCDYHSDEEACKTPTLPVEYPDIASAEAAARAIIHALASFNDLEVENQGDQYMAYYPGGHDKEGMGAYTASVYDEAGARYEGLT